jgi:hypothetical protein
MPRKSRCPRLAVPKSRSGNCDFAGSCSPSDLPERRFNREVGQSFGK